MWTPEAQGKQTNCQEFWDKNTRKIEPTGPSGFSVLNVRSGVLTLVYRDEEGILKGLLNYYPNGIFARNKPGEVELLVHPDARRQGIGMKVLKEGIRLWDIQARKQRYNPASAGLTEAWLKEHRSQ